VNANHASLCNTVNLRPEATVHGMKILHVETGRHLYGGPQQVLYLCGGLARSGVDNLLVCPPGSDVDVAARSQGIEVLNLECAGDLDLRFMWRLRQVLDEQEPDIVHCHSRRGGDFLGGQAAAMAGTPAVLSRRVDNSEPGFLSGLRYRHFRKVIAISEAIAGVIADAGLGRDRIEVIRSAIDAERFSAKPDIEQYQRLFRIEPDHFVVASAAQFIPRKGHRYLLRAAAELRHRYPQLKLVLFGQGPLENELRAMTADLELGNMVQFAGFREDLDDYLGCFDILAHPALKEGLGVIALKASAAGVPVVGFAAGGLGEVVRHEESGLLVPVGDSQKLAEAIELLINDSELRSQYGRIAAQRMRDHFSVVQMVDKHITMYESILDA
jgi:glycosyltransferase involved in cell wall biosynthesis